MYSLILSIIYTKCKISKYIKYLFREYRGMILVIFIKTLEEIIKIGSIKNALYLYQFCKLSRHLSLAKLCCYILIHIKFLLGKRTYFPHSLCKMLHTNL